MFLCDRERDTRAAQITLSNETIVNDTRIIFEINFYINSTQKKHSSKIRFIFENAFHLFGDLRFQYSRETDSNQVSKKYTTGLKISNTSASKTNF